MAPRKKRKSAPPVIGVDRIGDLPDHMLHHVLSFLPAQAAVRTCMLARRWRHLWKSTTGLRIVGLNDPRYCVEVQQLRKFVDHLLILRERTDLETVEIKFSQFSEADMPYLNLWIRYAVMSKVRALTVHLDGEFILFLDPLVSQHLRTLDLEGVALEKSVLDFASCPALEDLKMGRCVINAGRISSRSLKHLIIFGCRSKLDRRIHVSIPGLVSLKLTNFAGKTPFLENMPLLERARVYLSNNSNEDCLNYYTRDLCADNDNACAICLANNDASGDCVLLGGISSARHLVLLSESAKATFTRDLKHCPTFTKLKTLLLNEYWCDAPDVDPLACILKNSPVLEKLTLQLFSWGPHHKVEMKGTYSPVEGTTAISKHLNIVEVKCNVVDERVVEVLKFLCAFNIRFSFE
uniref:Uncharacterized protein n=1 Tax=Avena sativa TaxID=4498 RepID=A0ACD5Z7U5_AVESA